MVYISASAKCLTVIDCLLEYQWREGTNYVTYPYLDLDLSNSSYSGVLSDLGYSYGTQLASVSDIMSSGGKGTLTNTFNWKEGVRIQFINCQYQ